MGFFEKKWLASLLLLAFSWNFVFSYSYTPATLNQMARASFVLFAYILSPSTASARTAPDPDDYTINKIPGSFVDISTTGTEIAPALSDDGGVYGVPIGFGFEFFGTIFNTAAISADGYVTFGILAGYQNNPIPTPDESNSLIAPFWDDLNPELNAQSALYYETLGAAPNRRFVVQWQDIPLAMDPASRLTFEVVLFEESNEIQFQYFSMQDGTGITGSGPASGSLASIGIENADGSRGKEISFNLDGAVTEGSAFGFTLGGNAFEDGRKLGDLDGDKVITVLDQYILAKMHSNGPELKTCRELLLSDLAPQPGSDGRPFGDGKINNLDNVLITDAAMRRRNLNPTLSNVSSLVAPVGDPLTLYGSGFSPVAADNTVIFVDVNGVQTEAVADSVNADGTALTVVVPAGVLQITSVRVEHDGLASNSHDFVIEGSPTITALVPNNGEPGDVILIRGFEFDPVPGNNDVRFNGLAATVNSVSAAGVYDELSVAVPAGVTTGQVTVTAAGQTSNGETFILDGPPVVAINSPIEDGEITAPTDIIGTASDLKLAGYTLEYAPVGGDFTTFAAGNSVVNNDVLGNLDTSLLVNGLYQLRLTAEDMSGKVSSITRNFQVAGAVKPGVFTMTFTDLHVPLSGIPIEITRTYDSRKRNESDDFGYGWEVGVKRGTYENNRKPGDGWVILPSDDFFRFPCSNSIGTKGHVTEIRFSDREFYRFAFKVEMYGLGSVVGGGCQGTGRFVQIDGVPGATLTPLDFSGDILWKSGTNHVADVANITEVFEPQHVRLTTLDGRTFDLTLKDGLVALQDTNGNSLVINDDGIVHSSGKSISFARDALGRITRITDPMGQIMTYTYDAAGDLQAFTDRATNKTSFSYDADHFLLEIRDPSGNKPLTNEYSADGRLVAQIDGNGNRTEYTRDIAGQEEIVRDSRGNITRYLYDTRGNVLLQEQTVTIAGTTVLATTTYVYDDKDNVIEQTDPDGLRIDTTYDSNNNPLTTVVDPGGLNLVTSYTYNTRGQLLTHSDPLGNYIEYIYDALGNISEFKDASGNIRKFNYNSQGIVNRSEDPLGNVTTFTVNVFGQITREEVYNDSGDLFRIKEFSYDGNGNKLAETLFRTINGSLLPITTSFEYDAQDRSVKTIAPLESESRIQYNAMGKKSALIDPLSRQIIFEYDAMGDLIRTTYPDGTHEAIQYDASGNVIEKTDRANRMTKFEYDELNRRVKTIYPNGAESQVLYSPGGKVTAEIDGKENRIDYVYDTAGRRIKTILPSVIDANSGVNKRPEIIVEYDAAGNQTARIDANGNRTEFVYDKNGLLIETIFADGNFIEKHYNALGQAIEEMDEEGRITSRTYDRLGRLVSVTQPEPSPGESQPMTTFTYDEAGNKLTQTDALNRTTSFKYDELNRVIQRVLPGGEWETIDYDAVGNITARIDFNGDRTTYVYDVMNRLTEKTFDDGSNVAYTYTSTGQRHSVTDSRGTTTYEYNDLDRLAKVTHPGQEVISYAYDLNGNLASQTTPGGSVNYEYDALNRLTEVLSPNGDIHQYSYDAAGNRKYIYAPNDFITEYIYNRRNRLTQLTHQTSSGTIQDSFTYTLSPSGRRTSVIDGDGSIVVYTYDTLDRLTREERVGSNPYDTSYEYDSVGNRKRMLRNGVETLYNYDLNDRLQTAGSKSYVYDANGNTIQKVDGTSVLDYAYDFENRLTVMSDGTATTTFAYDADGNRVSKSTGSDVIKYLVDTLNNTGFAQVLEERDGSGALTAFYTYGDDLLSMERTAATSYYHYDGQMSTRLLTDSAGDVTDTYTYDAFGNNISHSGSAVNAYLYTGEQFDEDLQCYYLRARYYDPEIGRFSCQDPFGGIERDPLSLHKYLYANANPVNRIDPTGYISFTLPDISIAALIRGILRGSSYTIRSQKLCKAIKTAEAVQDIVYLVYTSYAIGQAIGYISKLYQNLNAYGTGWGNKYGISGPGLPGNISVGSPKFMFKGRGYVHSIELVGKHQFTGDPEIDVVIKGSSIKATRIRRVPPKERQINTLTISINLRDPSKSKVDGQLGMFNIPIYAIKATCGLKGLNLVEASVGLKKATRIGTIPIGTEISLGVNILSVFGFSFPLYKLGNF